MAEWCATVEAPLSRALPDARCPGMLLDPSIDGPRHKDLLRELSRPYTFEDFRESLDFRDLSQFHAWCAERLRGQQKENVDTVNTSGHLPGGRLESSAKDQ